MHSVLSHLGTEADEFGARANVELNRFCSGDTGPGCMREMGGRGVVFGDWERRDDGEQEEPPGGRDWEATASSEFGQGSK